MKHYAEIEKPVPKDHILYESISVEKKVHGNVQNMGAYGDSGFLGLRNLERGR